MDNITLYGGLSCKKLAPVVGSLCILIIAHTNGGKVRVHNVLAVTGAVHPGIYYLFGRTLAPGNIFAGISVSHTLLTQCSSKGTSVGTGVRKVLLTFLCAYLSRSLYLFIDS